MPRKISLSPQHLQALTNIASGNSDQTKVVIDSVCVVYEYLCKADVSQGAVPIFVRLVGHGSTDVQEQAVCVK